MKKIKSLINGIGNSSDVKKYYDQWSSNYELTLKKWNYKAPEDSINVLKKKIKIKPKIILDLACGTGLLGIAAIKIYPNIIIDGLDISIKSLKEAKKKKIYRDLSLFDFQKKLKVKFKKYDCVTCIGAMTYCQNPSKLLDEVINLIQKNGFFLFTHREDLWKKNNFTKLIKSKSKSWKKIYISQGIKYLPKNKEFSNKIKYKFCLIKKK